MTCSKCGADVHRFFAGRVEVLRHVVPPTNRQEAHYPVLTPRSGFLPPSVPPMRGGDEPQSRPPEPVSTESPPPAT